MKNTLLCIFIIITYINTLQAQTKIWGAGANNGVAAGGHNFVMVQANFKTTEAIQYILTDVAGRIIQMQNQKDASSLQRFNLKKLPAGTYFIIARNKTEETSTTFVKK